MPKTEISGSVFLFSNFTSALEVAIKDREVWVKGVLNFSLKALASG